MPVGPSMRCGGGGAKAARRAGRGGWRRAAVVLLLALAYAAGLLMFVLGGGGSVRRHICLGHHLRRLRLRFMASQHLMTSHYQNSGELWMPCVNKRLIQSELLPSNGYLIIEANGGLNQQRLSVALKLHVLDVWVLLHSRC